MDHLSKQQIVLLTLLVSFVTSIATGIFTVSLMDQAPPNVVQTISRVVEKTIDTKKQDASVNSVSTSNKLPETLSAIYSSIVKIRDAKTKQFISLGIILNSKGTIISDKTSLFNFQNYEAVLQDGVVVPVAVVRSQIEGDIAFLFPITAASTKFEPIMISKGYNVGDAVYSIYGTNDYSLGIGVISSKNTLDERGQSLIETSITKNKINTGSPLFDDFGRLVGVAFTSSINDHSDAVFYNIVDIKKVEPKF
jgi:S1-C subfamily serine protease